MSHQKGIKDWFGWDHVDLTAAKIGIVLAVLLLGLRLLASQVFILVIPLALGTGCVLYYVSRNRRIPAVAVPTLPASVAGYLPSVVVVGLAALVWTIWSAGARTFPAYLLTGAIGTVLIAQILLHDDRLSTGVVLFEILVVAAVLRLSALYVTPGYVGVDVWTHVPVFIDGILQQGSVSAMGDTKYVMAPFYHVIGALGGLVTGDARSGTYLALGLLVTLSSLFIFSTARLFVATRWALLATALYAFSDQFIRWGMHLIPTSLGLVFFLGALYCVTKLYFTSADEWVVLLLAVFSLAVIFTHQVSTAILLVFLGIAAGVSVGIDLLGPGSGLRRFTRESLALSWVFAITLVVTIWSWANTPFSEGRTIFLWNRFRVIAEAISQAGFLQLASQGGSGAQPSAASQTFEAAIAPYVDVFGFALLLTAAVLGGLVMLGWRERADATLTHLLTAAAFFVLVFGLSLFGIRVLLPGRWMAFLYAPLVVIGAVGLAYLWGHAPRRVLLAVVVVLALGYPTTMVVAEKATLDSPVFDDNYIRFSYTESEIAALDTISTNRPPSLDQALHTDHPYRTIFESPGGYRARVLVMNQGQADSSSPVVYRTYQSTGPVTFHNPGPIPREGFTASFDADSVCHPSRNHVYANDQVRMCLPSLASPGVSG